jgi:hypothetical protein
MAITVRCACGKLFSVSERHAGRKGLCKACGGLVDIPLLRDFDEVSQGELRFPEPGPPPVVSRAPPPPPAAAVPPLPNGKAIIVGTPFVSKHIATTPL